jgi:transposase
MQRRFDGTPGEEATTMALYAGIDLHSNNSVLAVIDGQDTLRCRKRLPNDLARILSALAPHRDDLVGVVVESTYNWYWLVDGLMDAGYATHLAHTAAVPQYAGLKHGDDDSDARHLANLLRLEILPEGYVYPRAQRRVRDLLRQRLRLVQHSSSLMQSVQGLVSRLTGHGLSANAFRALTVTEVERLLPHELDRQTAWAPISVWLAARREIEDIEATVLGILRGQADFRQIKTAPGIGDILGPTILLETGPIERFASVGDYSSYCRMVEARRLSNGKKKGEGNRRSGNAFLCWAYMEAATFAIRYYEPVRRWYDRKASKRPRVLALKAVAHKIARGCYHVLRDHKAFDIDRAFG